MIRKLTTVTTAIGLLALALGQTGCSTMNNTEKGVGIGAAAGTGFGALVGKATGNTKAGAVIGGLTGAVAGGVIGNDIDKSEKKQADAKIAAASYAYDQAQPSRIEEIVQMVKNGQSDAVIVNHIQQNHMRFTLSANDLNYLKSNNVPDKVIVEMQNSAQRVIVGPQPRPVIVQEQVIVRDPYYYRPAPAPVIFVEPGYRRYRW